MIRTKFKGISQFERWKRTIRDFLIGLAEFIKTIFHGNFCWLLTSRDMFLWFVLFGNAYFGKMSYYIPENRFPHDSKNFSVKNLLFKNSGGHYYPNKSPTFRVFKL